MAISNKQPDPILDLIYEAAVDQQLWGAVLAQIADITGSKGGILFGQSMREGRVYFDFNGRLDEDCNQIYQKRHMQNPWSQHMEGRPVGRVVFSDDAVELATLRKTAFFDEVLFPQDVAHNGMIPLAANNGFRAAFNICRSAQQGPFGAQERRLFDWLAPHLCRSIALGFRLETFQHLQRAAFDVLERMSDSVMVFDRRAQLLFANAAARALENSGVLRVQKAIATGSSAHTQQLGKLLKAALNGDAGGSMTLPGRSPAQTFTVIVSSLRGNDIGRFSDQNLKDAAVLMFVINPASQNVIPNRRLRDAYGLTPAEARIAVALSSGQTISETAQSLGLSPNTIKTQVRRVFRKTGTQRQAELVRLVTLMGSVRLRVDGDY